MRIGAGTVISALLIVLASPCYGAEEATMADAAQLELEAQDARAGADREEAEAREAKASAQHGGRGAKVRADKAAFEAAEAGARADRLEVEAREAKIMAGGE